MPTLPVSRDGPQSTQSSLTPFKCFPPTGFYNPAHEVGLAVRAVQSGSLSDSFLLCAFAVSSGCQAEAQGQAPLTTHRAGLFGSRRLAAPTSETSGNGLAPFFFSPTAAQLTPI